MKKKLFLISLMAALVGGVVKMLKGRFGGKTAEEEE